jgi:hypothetical protein
MEFMGGNERRMKEKGSMERAANEQQHSLEDEHNEVVVKMIKSGIWAWRCWVPGRNVECSQPSCLQPFHAFSPTLYTVSPWSLVSIVRSPHRRAFRSRGVYIR